MKEEDGEKKVAVFLQYFGGALILIVGLMVIYNWALGVWLGPLDGRGEFGDQFGAVNAVLTGTAFFGVMLSVMIQSRDLRSQTRALELQQEALRLQITEFKEQKEEMRRSAEAQEVSNEIERLKIRIEALKQRIGFNLVKYQQAGSEGGGRLVAHDRVADLLAQLDVLVSEVEGGDQSSGPTGA